MSEDSSSTGSSKASVTAVSARSSLTSIAGGGGGMIRGRAARARCRLQRLGSRAADLLASSSAMMRRMEARISSIDGSCDFAGCWSSAHPSNTIRPLPPRLIRGWRPVFRTDRAPPKSSCPTCPATDRDGSSPATNRQIASATMQRSPQVCHDESRTQAAIRARREFAVQEDRRLLIICRRGFASPPRHRASADNAPRIVDQNVESELGIDNAPTAASKV